MKDEDKKITLGDVIDKVDFSKLDLSKENMKRTINLSKEFVLLKDYDTTYDLLEIIVEGESFFDAVFDTGYKSKLSEEYLNMRVISVHDYPDTESTSVILERVKQA